VRRATDPGSERTENAYRQPRKFPTRDDRDAYLESTYTYDRREFGDVHSTLQLVSDRREEFVEEFHREFMRGRLTGPVAEAFEDWQVKRFGRVLEPTAYGILWTLIDLRVVYDRTGKTHEAKSRRARPLWRSIDQMDLWCSCVRDVRREEGEGIEDWLRRIARYAGAKLEEKERDEMKVAI
jgi:hypothetical protein